jgi:hypothetical protein
MRVACVLFRTTIQIATVISELRGVGKRRWKLAASSGRLNTSRLLSFHHLNIPAVANYLSQ